MFRKSSKKGKKMLVSIEDHDGFEQEHEENIEIKFQVPRKRNRGISSSKIFEDNDEPVDYTENLKKKFVKAQPQTENAKDNKLTKNIKQSFDIEKNLTRAENDSLSEDQLYQIPEQYRTENLKFTERSENPLWITGLEEIALSIEHKIDNIEATEAAKRRAIKDGSSYVSRFSKLHDEEYEQFNQNLSNIRNFEKMSERIEKKMLLKGKKYKLEKEARVKQNQNIEKSWQNK